MVGSAVRHGTAVAATMHISHLLWAVQLPTRSQSILQSKLVLVSRQALLENTGFQPGDRCTFYGDLRLNTFVLINM